MLNRIHQIRPYFLIITKIIGLVVCLYFMYQAKHYQVSWNLFTLWLFPSWVLSLNTFLSTVGTYILIIPVIFIISSFLVDSNLLNVIACLFSVSSGAISLTINVALGQLYEVTRLKLFTIFHSVSLATKQKLFRETFQTDAEALCKAMPAKYDFVLSKLSDSHFIVYDHKLNSMPANDVSSYAHRVVQELMSAYDRNQPSIFSKLGNFLWEGATFNHVMCIILIAACAVGGYKLFSWLSTDTDAALKAGATLQKPLLSCLQQGKLSQLLGFSIYKLPFLLFATLCTNALLCALKAWKNNKQTLPHYSLNPECQ